MTDDLMVGNIGMLLALINIHIRKDLKKNGDLR